MHEGTSMAGHKIGSAVLVAMMLGLIACTPDLHDDANRHDEMMGGRQTAAELARGEYLVTSIAGCGNCHTPKGPDGEIAELTLAGGQPFPDLGAIASNITPDMKTGIGSWSVDEIVSGIRNGIRPDGTLIGPPMPFEFYRDMSDSDAYAIASYLVMSVEPVANKVPASDYVVPLPNSYGPDVVHVADVPQRKTVEYGAYLAGPVGHCIECHTPRGRDGHLQLDDMTAAGGQEFPGPWGLSVSADIRAGDSQYGLGSWDDKDIVAAITQGVRPDGQHLNPPMGFHYYNRMTKEDLSALVAYLRSLSVQ